MAWVPLQAPLQKTVTLFMPRILLGLEKHQALAEQGLGFGVLEFLNLMSSRSRQAIEARVYSPGFRVQGSGFRV